MADDVEKDQKTEDATPKRLQDAIDKGQVAFSKEVSNLFILLAFAISLAWFIPESMKSTILYLSPFFSDLHDMEVIDGSGQKFAFKILINFASILAIPSLLAIAAVFASSLLQNGFVFSSHSIMPDLGKISPIRGLGRMFSWRSVLELIKGLVKIILVGVISYIAIKPYLLQIVELPNYDTMALLIFISKLVMRIMIGICAFMIMIAGLDFAYQKWEFHKSLRMTKTELKEEFKQSEGDPKIKAKIKKLRTERARKRMMSAIPDADVVITNPTHFAVALKYDSAKMSSPMLVAKGQDLVAWNIRKRAEEFNVPIVENPPLARALFSSVEIDEYIPAEHFQAVAEVIAYVYRIKGKKAA